jgi:hypothetical protein
MKRALLLSLLLFAACVRKPESLRNEAKAILDEEVDCVEVGVHDLICRGRRTRRPLRCTGASGCEPLVVAPCLQADLPAERP